MVCFYTVLGWTQEEIGEAVGITQSAYAEGFLSEFPELKKAIKSLLSTGLPVTEVAQRFNLTPLLTCCSLCGVPSVDSQNASSHAPGGTTRHVARFWDETGHLVCPPNTLKQQKEAVRPPYSLSAFLSSGVANNSSSPLGLIPCLVF